jgi:hypothetical protein
MRSRYIAGEPRGSEGVAHALVREVVPTLGWRLDGARELLWAAGALLFSEKSVQRARAAALRQTGDAGRVYFGDVEIERPWDEVMLEFGRMWIVCVTRLGDASSLDSAA